MALGDLVVDPDDIEWLNRRLRTTPDGSSIYLGASSVVRGLGVNEYDLNPDDLQDGASLGAVSLAGRLVTVTDVTCVDDDALASLRAAMVPQAPAPFVWLGHGAAEKRVLYVVPSAAQEVSRPEDQDGYRQVVCDWFAPDPRQLSLTETTTTVSGSNPAVANGGSWPAPWRAVVTGACVGPRFRDVSVSGRVLRFDAVTVPGGQTFTVDTRAQTAVLSGSPTVDRWHLGVDDDGRPTVPWGVPPGGCQVGFASESGASSAAFYSRGCWL